MGTAGNYDTVGVIIDTKEKGIDEVNRKLDKLIDKLDKARKTDLKKARTRKKELKIDKEKLKVDKQTSNTMRDTYRMYLPLLFVSQKLGQATKNLLQPSMDMLGVQELWNTMLAVSFLPTAENTLDGILRYGEALMDLSEKERLVIGDQLQFAQVMASGAELGASLAMAVGGTNNALVTMAAAAAGATAAGVALSNETTTAIAAVSGLEAELLLVGSASSVAAANLETTKSDIEKINDMKLLLVTTVSRDEYDKLLLDINTEVTDEKKLEVIANWTELNRPKWLDEDGNLSVTWEDTFFQSIKNFADKLENWLESKLNLTPTHILEQKSINVKLGGGAPVTVPIRGKTREEDFISRPGQAPVSFSPNDTIVGFKGGEGGGMGGVNAVINVNVDANVSSDTDMDELSRRVGDRVRRELGSLISR